jgi:hypothetical protein
MKLDHSINFISTGKNSFGMSSFVMEDNLRFIDLDNINKYTKKQIFSILTSVGIFTNSSYKKDTLISFLMKDEKALNKIKADNREWKLNQLVSQ